jgi:hypothetical protein
MRKIRYSTKIILTTLASIIALSMLLFVTAYTFYYLGKNSKSTVATSSSSSSVQSSVVVTSSSSSVQTSSMSSVKVFAINEAVLVDSGWAKSLDSTNDKLVFDKEGTQLVISKVEKEIAGACLALNLVQPINSNWFRVKGAYKESRVFVPAANILDQGKCNFGEREVAQVTSKNSIGDLVTIELKNADLQKDIADSLIEKIEFK